MYIAKISEDHSLGDNPTMFAIYSPIERVDIAGNPHTDLGQPYKITSEQNLQDEMANLQAIWDAITACQNGVDAQTQYSNAMQSKMGG